MYSQLKWKLPGLLLVLTIIFSSSGLSQEVLSGQVWDGESNTPLVGASVDVSGLGTPSSVITGDSGKFTISIPDLQRSLVVSYRGYEQIEMDLNGRHQVNIFLIPQETTLDEVVVLGYGTQSRRRVTSSISSIGEEVFERIPETNFQTSMGGRIPGLMVTQSNGQPGSSVSMRVRGPSSVSGDNQPLIVVDGMIISGQLTNLNPNDIASVEVLKDAAATSIYGSQGANGVILVTTRRGNFQENPTVNIDYYAGYSEPTRFYDLLDGEEYAQLWNQAADAVGASPDSYFTLGQQPNANWLDLITRKGLVQSVNVSVRGGRSEHPVLSERSLSRGAVLLSGKGAHVVQLSVKYRPTDQ